MNGVVIQVLVLRDLRHEQENLVGFLCGHKN